MKPLAERQANYEALMAEARRFNAEMDKIEVGQGWARPKDCSPPIALRTAMMAIQAGIVTENWTCVAEAQAMLEDLLERTPDVEGYDDDVEDE